MTRARALVKVCGECGHPLADPDAYDLFPAQRRVFDVIERAGRAGVTRREILERAWADDPNGGPLTGSVVSVHVRAINEKIEKHGLTIRCDSEGSHYSKYRLYRHKKGPARGRVRLSLV